MMRIALALAVVLLTSAVYGQQPIIYPAKGQGSQWQMSDVGQCEAWARQITGVNPAA
jgi:hypothetical protein